MAEKKIQENPLPDAPEPDKEPEMPKPKPPVQEPSTTRLCVPSLTKTPPNDLYRRLLPAVLFLLTFVTVMTMLLIYMDTVALGAQQFRLNMSRDYELARIPQESPSLVAYVRQLHLAPRPHRAPPAPRRTPPAALLDRLLGELVSRSYELARIPQEYPSLVAYVRQLHLAPRPHRAPPAPRRTPPAALLDRLLGELVSRSYELARIPQESPSLVAYVRQLHLAPRPHRAPPAPRRTPPAALLDRLLGELVSRSYELARIPQESPSLVAYVRQLHLAPRPHRAPPAPRRTPPAALLDRLLGELVSRSYELARIPQESPSLVAYVRQLHLAPRPHRAPPAPRRTPPAALLDRLLGELVSRSYELARIPQESPSLVAYVRQLHLAPRPHRAPPAPRRTPPAALLDRLLGELVSRSYELARIPQESPSLVAYVRQLHLAPRPHRAPPAPRRTPPAALLDRLLGELYNGTFVEFLPLGPRDPTTLYLEAARGWAGVVVRAAPRDYLALRGAARALHACLSPSDHPREVTYNESDEHDTLFRSRVLCLPLYTVLLAAEATRAEYLLLGGPAHLKHVPFHKVRLQVIEYRSSDMAARNQTTEFLLSKNYTIAATFDDSIMYALNDLIEN